MGEGNSTDELLVHIEYIKQGIDGINIRLDQQNGRVRTAETDIAILKDRQSEARKHGSQWGGVAGGFAGGFVAALVSYFGGGK